MYSLLLLPAEVSLLAALALIAFSFLTSAISAAFLSPARYGRDRTVSTHAACMTIQHLLKVIAFGFLGFVLTQWLLLVAAMIFSGLLGTWMGRGLLQRLPEHVFRHIFKAVLTVLAVRLLYKAVMVW